MIEQHSSTSTDPPRAGVTAASSAHPVAAHAVAECAGALLDASPGGHDRLFCIAGSSFGGALGDITDAMGALVGASEVAGIESDAVLMGARVAQGSPALAVIAFNAVPVSFSELDPCESSGADGDLSVVFADPFALAPALPTTTPRSDPRAAITSTGGILEPVPPGAGLRSVLGGIERRGVPVCMRVPADHARVTRVNDTRAIGPEMTVTSVSDDQIVALDELPAAEALASLVRPLDLGPPGETQRIGFTVVGDDRLIAVGRSPFGLQAAVPVPIGTTLVPSVSSNWAASENLADAIHHHVGNTDSREPVAALVMLTGDFIWNFPHLDYEEIAADAGGDLIGLRVDGILAPSASGFEVMRPGAAVVRFARRFWPSERGHADR